MNKKTAQILKFNQVGRTDIPYVGGKGANLGEMVAANIPVPDGFIVTAKAYYDFLKLTSLKEKIITELSGLDVDDSDKLHAASKKVRTAILQAKMPDELAERIKKAYHELSGKHDKLVAVRSSATAEDLPDASFAGQQDTYLNVQGWEDVVKHAQKCWASLFTSRAIFYRTEQGFSHFKVGIAVPVQLMIQSEVSGIMFTVNPLTNNPKEVSIEAGYGLGQPIVSGEITPDQYIVRKKTEEIIVKEIMKQTWQYTIEKKVPVSKKYQKLQKMSDKKIVELAKIGMHIEEHYKHPQDIEWGMENNKLYIVQSRPVTTLDSQNKKPAEVTKIDAGKKGKKILEGLGASPGAAAGKVVKVDKPSEINKVKEGDILVAVMTNPDYVPAMRRAGAILTDEGGRTSHAAIVSRELGIPAVVGSNQATKLLKEGELITVDGSEGMVYEGDVTKTVKAEVIDTSNLKTATKIYMNLGEPQLSVEMAQKNVDGIGLLRAEFMIANMGKHPMAFVKEKKQKEFIERLATDLETFVSAFDPRPVVYRFTDFRTNEFKGLLGGEAFEEDEYNPMIGYRGVSRYLEDADVFKMEIEAIKIVRNKKGYKNLHVMFPFVRTLGQLKEVKSLMGSYGLRRSGSFKVWMMVEIPSNVILLDEFIDIGIDGVSVGTNDLTMLTLGVDRDNERVANVYSEMDGAVLASLEKIVKTAKKRGITSSICGQAPSVYPELVKMLVEWGITSVSLSPDVLDKTRKIVYDMEKKVLGSGKKKK
ncbi:phosphoenolpyruvate synthase [Patescibacteria group bacterium]